MMRKRVLLYSEGVTLSQIVRLVTLGRALDPTRYSVTFACSTFDELVFRDTDFQRRTVRSLSPDAVLRALRRGRRLYDTRTLLAQIREDLEVFEETKPDLVVGDFRWSLAVSAPVFGVPHAALVNAYWSPFARRSAFPVPDHPIVGLLGEELTARYFPRALPRVFAHFAEPLNAARREYGLAPVGSLLDVLTYGDYTLFADPEALVPTPGAPPTHEHLGFVPWSPGTALPESLARLPEDRPLVYATLGSSGRVDALPLVIEALGDLPVTGVVATAARRWLSRVPANVHVTDYLPGDLLARRAALVVSNGGSSTSYQALAEGTPVLGLASNLDQFLAMEAIERHSAGILHRARSATTSSIRALMNRLLSSREHRDGALRVREHLVAASAAERFRGFVERATSARPPGRREDGPSGASRVGRWLSTGLALVSIATSGVPDGRAEPARSPVAGEIRFTAKVPGEGGHVICALFREDGWLKRPVATVKAPLRAHESTCVFGSVKPGTYGIVAFHDENDNGDIDKNFLGIPTESWCTSRNAKAVFGPPSFGDAKFLSRGNIVRLAGTM